MDNILARQNDRAAACASACWREGTADAAGIQSPSSRAASSAAPVSNSSSWNSRLGRSGE